MGQSVANSGLNPDNIPSRYHLCAAPSPVYTVIRICAVLLRCQEAANISYPDVIVLPESHAAVVAKLGRGKATLTVGPSTILRSFSLIMRAR